MRFVIAYEGTRYAGWQRQKNGQAVQGVLEAALSELEARDVAVLGASRTDAGVHALGQVAWAETRRPLDPERYRIALNALLPDDVRVRRCDLPEGKFLPLQGVIEKTYAYRVDLGPAPDPRTRRFALHHPAPLDVSTVDVALAGVLGHRDFRHFASSGGSARTTERTLREARVERLAPDAIELRFSADGFLYHMVRNLVGAALRVGEGRAEPEFLVRILRDGPPPTGIKLAPAHGLTLLGIAYGPPIPLDSRQVP
ncbi:MAG: tRNA pseudouridine synthase A [Thermaerobacter sp.]|nr:tRNA pseudouridine synthase A [Thermaerobacter sp.]